MARIILDITMSLDGYVTGPNDGPGNGLGDGGGPLHRWVFDLRDLADDELLQTAMAGTGAVVMGRRTFDVVDGPSGWSDELAFGGPRTGAALPMPPCFVVTHHPPEHVRLERLFTFVTEGIERAVALAAEAAGDRDVSVMGGANLITGCLQAGVGDELRIHLAPMILGAGRRLFDGIDHPIELERLDVMPTRGATHLRYAITPPAG